jgi:cytochrome c oxidase subunit 1
MFSAQHQIRWEGTLLLATLVITVVAATAGMTDPHGHARTALDSLAVYAIALPAGVPLLVSLLRTRTPGAESAVFPVMSRIAWLMQAAATLLLAISVVVRRTDEVDASWHFFTAASGLVTGGEVDMRIVGALLAIVSLQLTAIQFLATARRSRPVHNLWKAGPALAEAIYVRSLVVCGTAPILFASLLLLLLERQFSLGLFYGTDGGDPVLFQHMFWFGMHPILATSVLPALGSAIQQALDTQEIQAEPGRLVHVAILAAAVGSVLASGQHVHSAGVVHTALTSLYALLAALPLVVLTTWLSFMFAGQTGGSRPVNWLARLVPVFIAIFAARSMVAALPLLSMGMDMRLFSSEGIFLMFAIVLSGALSAMSRRPAEQRVDHAAPSLNLAVAIPTLLALALAVRLGLLALDSTLNRVTWNLVGVVLLSVAFGSMAASTWNMTGRRSTATSLLA